MSAIRVEVPDIGDAENVDVVEVLVKPGSAVQREQGLIVIESDKASMEIPSPAAGTVQELSVKVGDKVSKGTLIAMLESAEKSAAPAAAQPKAATPQKAAAAPAAPQPKAAAPQKPAAPAPKPQTPAKRVAPAREPTEPEEQEAEAVEDIKEELEQQEPPPDARTRPVNDAAPSRTIPPPPPPPSRTSEPPPKPAEKMPHAAPSLRKLARELGVDLRQIPGSGPHSRITRDDVQRYVKHAMSVTGTATGTGFAVPELPEIDFSKFGETSTEPLTKIQKLTGRNLHRSWVTIPHVTQHDEADITELEAFRHKMKADRPDVKLTVTAFFMKALSVVLKHMPRFNASLDKSGENLILKHYMHLGVAVDTPQGLVVPVIRDVDQKGLAELAIELALVSERARNRKLLPQDLQGASMTISSLGGIGGTHFTPIINPPEVAVLGVSRASQKPVYIDGKLEPRLIVGLSLSYDHRVIDGAAGVRFTSRLREVLGDIREMLL